MKKKYRIKSKFRFTLFLTIALLLSINIAGTMIGLNTSESLTKTTYTEIQIQAGDTLWNLADQYGPDDKDLREVVYEICQLNDVSADTLYPGQSIIIPKYI